MATPDRPPLLGIVALVSLLVGVGLVIASVVTFVVGSVNLVTQTSTLDITRSWGTLGQGVGLLVMAAIAFALALGIARGEIWAWFLGLLVAGANVLAGLFDLAQGHIGGIFTMALFGLFAWYLVQPEPRRYFGTEGIGFTRGKPA